METRVWSIALLLVLPSCQGSEPEPMPDPPKQAAWKPLGAAETYAGKTLEEWTVEWSLWSYAQNTCDSAEFDLDGSQCGLYQDPDSPVFFLQFAPSSAPRTKCRVPSGKAILVPAAIASVDNAGSSKPLADDALFAAAARVLDSMRDLSIRADGTEVTDLEERGIGPVRFSYSLPAAPNFYSCRGQKGIAETTIDPSYAIGYVALFPPPPPGKHTMEFASALTYFGHDAATDTVTKFVVEEEHE